MSRWWVRFIFGSVESVSNTPFGVGLTEELEDLPQLDTILETHQEGGTPVQNPQTPSPGDSPFIHELQPTLAARITGFFFTDEKTQKFTLIFLSFASMVGMTWYLKTYPFPPEAVGLRLNLTNILWFSAIYFYYQVYSLIFNMDPEEYGGGPLPSYQFLIEFLKFFLALTSTFFYTQNFFAKRSILESLQVYGYSSFLLMYSLFSIVAAVVFYRFQFLKSLALQSRVAEAEAQYSMLESQMQPHFLFNSLNVLSELIYVDPDHANAMTQKLADLYREILHNSKNKFSTLASELSILRKYVEIQKIRFGDRIRYSESVPSQYDSLPIPSLLLQTLVENAIKHGIAPKSEGGQITISVKTHGNLYQVQITNTGALYKGHKSEKRSTGLQNTVNRLDLMYGDRHDFKIFSDDKKTYVQFNITGRI